jgi:Sulfatase
MRRPRLLRWRGRPAGRVGFLLFGALLLSAGAACRPSGRKPFAGVSRADVVLITIDTLRADSVGFLGNRRVETPVLDRLAREGRVFPDAHAQNVVTLPSHANILTGLYPFQHGVRDNEGFVLPSRAGTGRPLSSALSRSMPASAFREASTSTTSRIPRGRMRTSS